MQTPRTGFCPNRGFAAAGPGHTSAAGHRFVAFSPRRAAVHSQGREPLEEEPDPIIPVFSPGRAAVSRLRGRGKIRRAADSVGCTAGWYMHRRP